MSKLTEINNKFINIFVASVMITIAFLIITIVCELVLTNFETIQFGNF